MNDLLPSYHLSDGAKRPDSILGSPNRAYKSGILVGFREALHFAMIDNFWSAVPKSMVQVAAPELSF